MPKFLYVDNATQSSNLHDKGVIELRHFLMSVESREGGREEGRERGGSHQLRLEQPKWLKPQAAIGSSHTVFKNIVITSEMYARM